MSSQQFGYSNQNLQVGTFATVNDASSNDIYGPQGWPQPLGSKYVNVDATYGEQIFRYVKLNSTAPPTLVAKGVVYWKDAAHTTVTAVLSESLTGTANSVAGILLNANATNGNGVWIQTGGYITGCQAPASTAKGDAIIGATGATQTVARVAANTAPTNQVLYWAQTAVSGGVADGFIAVESL